MPGDRPRAAALAAAALMASAAAAPASTTVTGDSLGGVRLGADVAAVRARFGGERLRVVTDGPWTAFVIEGAHVTVGFDGEGRELKDGADSFSVIGRTLGWDALRPGLHVRMLETTSPTYHTPDGLHAGGPLAASGRAALKVERTQGEAWARRADGVYLRVDGVGARVVALRIRASATS